MTTTLLFDIDQTLLYSGGAGGLAMRRAFEMLYGVEDGFKRVEFSGRTDWSILRRALEIHDVVGDTREGFEAEMSRFQEAYYHELERTLREVEGRTLPGVPALIDALASRNGARLGLATGNFRHSALMKLHHYRLDAHLREGGFGDDAEDRAQVVRLAIERVADGSTGPVWVIGDTPLDISAAHANGAKALGVATGPVSAAELLDAGAEAAVDDLSDTARVLEVLAG